MECELENIIRDNKKHETFNRKSWVHDGAWGISCALSVCAVDQKKASALAKEGTVFDRQYGSSGFGFRELHEGKLQ